MINKNLRLTFTDKDSIIDKSGNSLITHTL